MSWLTNLIPKKNNQSSSDDEKQAIRELQTKKNLYISIDFCSVKFLGIDESVAPHKIVFWKQVMTGPFEDINAGKPVKDIYSVLEKILSQEKDLLNDYGSFSVSISAEGVFFRTIEVAKIENSLMQKSLLGEIKRTLPVDFSQVLYAQNDLGEKHENLNTFFCVLIQKTVFEKMKEVFAKFNLSPYFEIEVFSLARIPARGDEYKLIVHVAENYSLLIFTKGQIIQEVVSLEIGNNTINDAIVKGLSIPYPDVLNLRESHEVLHEEGRLGGRILDEYVKDFNKSLSKVIALHILEFENKFSTEIKELIISGSSASPKLNRNIHEEFDAELDVNFVSEKYFDQFQAENFLEKDVKSYAQNFGLAKRVK